MVAFPLPHYEGDEGRTKTAGTDALKQETKYARIGTDIQTRAVTAGGQVEGLLEAPVKSSAKETAQQAADLGGAATLAAGALGSFGQAIGRYNRKVDTLNERYRNAKAGGFGVAADAGAQEGMSDAEKATAHGNAVDAADQALRRELEAERKTAETNLEDDGDAAADSLDKGPSEATILAYALSGALPASQVVPYVGKTLAQINDIRAQISTARTVFNKPLRNYANLASYLSGINTKAVNQRTQMRIAMQMRQIMLANRGQGLSLAQRLAAFKAGKVDAAVMARNFAREARKLKLVKDFTPGSFFKDTGRIGSFLAKNKIASVLNKGLGRVLAPLGAVAGGYGLYTTVRDWDKLSTEKKVTGLVGNGSALVAGGLGTAAMIAGAAGLAFPPALAVAGIVAGGIALGTMVYENWDSIKGAASDAVEGIKDFGEGAVDTVKDVGGAIKDGLSSIF